MAVKAGPAGGRLARNSQPGPITCSCSLHAAPLLYFESEQEAGQSQGVETRGFWGRTQEA